MRLLPALAAAVCALAAGVAGCADDEVAVMAKTLPATTSAPPPPPPTVPVTVTTVASAPVPPPAPPPPPTDTVLTPGPQGPTGPGGAPGEVLIRESWTTGAGGWPEPVGPRSRAGWDEGSRAYRIVVDVPQIRRQVLADARDLPRDLRIEVTATLSEGGEDDLDYRGVICRSDDDLQDYYGFLVRSDGSAAIARYDDGERTVLGDGRFQPSDAILTGRGEENRIAAECAGDSLTLFVNERQVVSVSDDRLTGRRAGMTASSGDDGGKVHIFDDLLVTG